MEHKPYYRNIPGSDCAVVMIHGILGTPNHFSFLIPLVPDHWSVYNILLDGHGGKAGDFSHTSMKKWKTQVTTLLDRVLEEHSRVILVAHSMGTLFSIQEAVDRPERIQALFLLQVPLYPRLKLTTALKSALLPFGVVWPGAQMMKDDCGVALDWRLWVYLGWIPRFLELFSECAHTRRLLPQLTVPCTAYQSERDELVSNRSAQELEKYGHIRTVRLPESGHFGHRGKELQFLQQEFAALVGEVHK